MGRSSLKAYLNDLLRRSQVQSGDLIIIDDNAKAPQHQSTPHSPYLDSLEFQKEPSEECSTPSRPVPSQLSRWDSATTPAASTRNARSGLGLPCRHSPLGETREKQARRGAIIIPFCLSDSTELAEDGALCALQALRNDGGLEISEEFSTGP